MILYIENPKNATRRLIELIMNLVKLQDTKLTYIYLLHLYIATNYLKEKLKNPIYSHIKKNKISRKKPT